MLLLRTATDTLNTKLHHYADDVPLIRASAPSYAEAMRVERLRYLRRLLEHAPIILLALVQSCGTAPGSWAHFCLPDLAWMHQQLGTSSPFQAPLVSSAAFAVVRGVSPSAWKQKLRAAKESCTRFRRDRHYAMLWTTAFSASSAAVGLGSTAPAAPAAKRFTCATCPFSSAIWQGLASHRMLVHGELHVATLFAHPHSTV